MTVPELIEKLQRLPGDSDLRIVRVRLAKRRQWEVADIRDVTGVVLDVVQVVLDTE